MPFAKISKTGSDPASSTDSTEKAPSSTEKVVYYNSAKKCDRISIVDVEAAEYLATYNQILPRWKSKVDVWVRMCPDDEKPHWLATMNLWKGLPLMFNIERWLGSPKKLYVSTDPYPPSRL